MPVEVYINREKNPNQNPHIVIPGGFATLPDFSSGEENKFGIHCLKDDSGVELFRAAVAELPEIPERFGKGIPSPLFHGKNRLGSFGPDQQAERILTDRHGKAVRLLMKHTFSK